MTRINSSRQSLAASQRNCNYKSNGQVAVHVAKATIYDESLVGAVIERNTDAPFGLEEGTTYFLVATKWAHRYVVVAQIEGEYRCSLESYAQAIQQVKAFLVERQETQAQALRMAYPVVGFQMTDREIAIADVIAAHPEWFVSVARLSGQAVA